MHTRLATFVRKLALGFGILLVLPSTALGAPMSISGPSSVSETAGVAAYTVNCGEASLLPGVLPDVPNEGALAVAAADGPAPAATSGSDYGTPSQSLLSCTALTTEYTFDVPITNDTIDEVDERFTVTASGALVPQGNVSESVTTTITDDDPLASVAPVALVAEGDSGTGVAQLQVTLASVAAQATTIAYSTEDFSATSGSDYVATSGNLVIPIGQKSGTISIPIVGDTTPEKVEAFYVNLLSTDNGALDGTKKQGAIGIFDNDTGPLPTISLEKISSVQEGDRGTGNLLFRVTLSSAATERTTVKWKTGEWTAQSGRDYKRDRGTVVFQQGQRSKTVSVDVLGDRRDEPDEAFTVALENPVAAALGARTAGFGVIEDDDGPKLKISKPRVRGKRLVTKVGCPDSADACTGRLVAKSAKLKLGRKKFDLEKGERKKLKLKLSRKALAALAESRRRAKLTATVTDSTGDTRVTKRKARLKRLR